MLVSLAFFLGSAVFGLYPLIVSAIFAIIVAFGQSRKQMADLLTWLMKRIDRQNFKPKKLIYPSVNIFIVLLLLFFQHSDAMIEFVDYATDSTVLCFLGFLWVTQPAHLRKRDMNSFIVIVLCVKNMFWFENEYTIQFEGIAC